ncbi:MAG: type VII toxin-antitoxin system MntA family adenylyltransferase antitoxin [Microgenomates group bacterium]
MITNFQKQKISQYFSKQPVELVYLFGSQAEGRVTSLSDYDFAVLFAENLSPEQRFDLKLKFMGDLGEILGTDKVEVLDLNQAPAAFRYSAFAPRQEIYVRNEAKRVDFETQTMSDYFDRQYFLRRHSLNSLANIAKEGFK